MAAAAEPPPTDPAAAAAAAAAADGAASDDSGGGGGGGGDDAPATPVEGAAFTALPLTARTALHIQDGADRSEWYARVQREHPEIRELRARLGALHRAISFARTFNAGRAQIKETLTSKMVVQLIEQHLEYSGLKNTRKILEDESRVRYTLQGLNDSRLVTVLRQSVRDVDRVYALTIGERVREGEDIASALRALGLEEKEEEQVDVNIWDEPEDNASNIVFGEADDGGGTELKAGTLNKLVERLTNAAKPDLAFMKTFLLTYQSFTTAGRFLEKLVQRYRVKRAAFASLPDDRFRKEVQMPIQLRVCNVLQQWLKQKFEDFTDKLQARVSEFAAEVERDNNKMLASQIRQVLKKQQEAAAGLRTGTSGHRFYEAPPEVKVPRNIFSTELSLWNVDEEEIARQLTLMEFAVYARIRSSELLNQSWNRSKYRHRSPNVLTMIHRFNDISSWVSTTVLRCERIRARIRVMSHFVRVAEHLRELNNFNGLFAILSGLNNASVHRLRWTKEEMPRRQQEASHRTYRTMLHSVEPPCIPYLGIYLTDMTFIEDGNPDYTAGGLINFTKRKFTFGVINEIQQYQLVGYNLSPVAQIQRFLTKFPTPMDDDALWRQSLKVEPRRAERTEIQ